MRPRLVRARNRKANQTLEQRCYLKDALAGIDEVLVVESNGDCLLDVMVHGQRQFDPAAVALASMSSIIGNNKYPLEDMQLDVQINVNAYLIPQHFVSVGSEDNLEQGCQQLVRTSEESTLEMYRAIQSGSVARVQALRKGPQVRDISDEPIRVLDGD